VTVVFFAALDKLHEGEVFGELVEGGANGDGLLIFGAAEGGGIGGFGEKGVKTVVAEGVSASQEAGRVVVVVVVGTVRAGQVNLHFVLLSVSNYNYR
jgi:hypothetical protein